MDKAISAFQGEVAFGFFDRRGSRSTKMGGQAVGLYSSKYVVDMLSGEDPVEASIFATRFSAIGGQYPCKDF